MRIVIAIATVAAAALRAIGAQQMPIRQIGRLEHVSTESLASALNAISLADGRVLVNDVRGRRVLLLDSTLSHASVVADTTSATANAYGRQGGTLIRYRADSSLFIDVSSLSMLVIAPNGAVARVMSVPHPDEAQQLIGEAFGVPGFDARGRLVYHASAGFQGNLILCCVEHPGHFDRSKFTHGVLDVPKPDSALLVAVDLAARTTDTLARIRVPEMKQRIRGDDQGAVQSIERVPTPAQAADAWAVTSDGRVVVIRGGDYHADILAADGRWTSAPRIPFAWVRLDDARKAAMIDSAVRAQQAIVDRMNAPATGTSSVGGRGGGGGGGGGGRGGGAGGGRGGTPIPAVVGRPELSEVPDYLPAFEEHAALSDDEGNVWIRTSTFADGRPVYDVIDRHGALVDRVQLPAFRTIAGFGPGVIYLAVRDNGGVVHLERARIR